MPSEQPVHSGHPEHRCCPRWVTIDTKNRLVVPSSHMVTFFNRWLALAMVYVLYLTATICSFLVTPLPPGIACKRRVKAEPTEKVVIRPDHTIDLVLIKQQH